MENRPTDSSFSQLLRTIRFRAGFYTLHELSDELYSTLGLVIDPSLMSHWQRGARLPKDRLTIINLLKVFIKHKGIVSSQEANKFSEAAGMGFLTDQEISELFSEKNPPKENNLILDKKETKVYFTAALNQKKELGTNYIKIIKTLQNEGYHVQYEHITDFSLDEVNKQSSISRINYYRKFLNWITESNLVVAEGSFPSTLNIGHEITVALDQNKIVILFYMQGRNSFILHGLRSPNLFLVEYTEENLERTVKDIMDFVQTSLSTPKPVIAKSTNGNNERL